jgi:hypothetical protein
MAIPMSVAAIGHATSLFLVISYVLCVAVGILFPAIAMHEAWAPLLPGFQWISWSSFFLRLVESDLWGWYTALLWGSLYLVIVRRNENRR